MHRSLGRFARFAKCPQATQQLTLHPRLNRMCASVTSREDVIPEGFKWLKMQKISWTDADKKPRVYEAVVRSTRRGTVDGVAIIALVKEQGKPTEIVLESQFRPAIGRTVIELPAGLIDEGEDAGQAAARELKEETGLHGQTKLVSIPGFNDPGITNANCQAVIVEVDASLPENRDPKTQLEAGEFIDVFRLPVDGLYVNLQDVAKQQDYDIDARLLTLALGMQCTNML